MKTLLKEWEYVYLEGFIYKYYILIHNVSNPHNFVFFFYISSIIDLERA